MSKAKKSLVKLAVMSCIVGNRYSYNDLGNNNGSAFFNSKGKRTKAQKRKIKRGKK